MDEEFDEQSMMEFINSLPKEQKDQLHELLNVLVYELFSSTNKEQNDLENLLYLYGASDTQQSSYFVKVY